MKTCSRCKIEKPLSEFNRRGGGHQAACRQCNSEYYKQYYKENPSEKERILQNNRARRAEIDEFIRNRKAKPCVDCGVEYPYYVMQFDHLSQSEKKFQIASSRNLYTIQQIQEEIAKCELVCANCHAERTHSRR